MHDLPVDDAEAGQRVAVNLPGVTRTQLRRGDALVQPGHYPVSWRLDVALEELEPVPAAVTVHVGTSDVPARVVREGRYAQLRLREPVLAAARRLDRPARRDDRRGAASCSTRHRRAGSIPSDSSCSSTGTRRRSSARWSTGR